MCLLLKHGTTIDAEEEGSTNVEARKFKGS